MVLTSMPDRVKVIHYCTGRHPVLQFYLQTKPNFPGTAEQIAALLHLVMLTVLQIDQIIQHKELFAQMINNELAHAGEIEQAIFIRITGSPIDLLDIFSIE